MSQRDHSLLLLLFVALGASAQDPLHRRFTMQDGLPSNTVYRSMQDHDGFLWLSTDAGAVRFDGKHMDRFGLEQGLSDEDVFGTKCDSKGRIWFFTANGLPCYVHGRTVHSGRTDTLLAKVQLRSGICGFQEDADGALWFGGLRGELSIVHPDGTVDQRDIHDPQSGLDPWVIYLHPTNDGGVQVFNGKWPVGLDGRVIPDYSEVGTWTERPDRPAPERFLFVGADTVEEWRKDHWGVLMTRYDLPGAPAIANVSLMADDEVWVSLRSGGVLWLRRIGGIWVPVRDIMFSGDLVTHVLRDHEGNIWMSTSYGGLIFVSDSGIETSFYPGIRGGNEEFLRAHAADEVGVWVGTNQGDVYRLGKQLELLDVPPAGPLFSRVSSIRSLGPELWVSTEHHTFRIGQASGAAIVQRVRAMTSPPERETESLGIKTLAMASNGRVVGSTYGLMEFDRRMNAFRQILDPEVSAVRIYAPHFDVHGTLWFEENGTLKSSSNTGYRSYPEIGLEAGYRITGITSIGDTLFLATNGKGIVVLVDTRPWRYITVADGLSSNNIMRIFADRGELFVATDRGAKRLSGPWGSPVLRPYSVRLAGAFRRVRDIVADSANAYVLFPEGLVKLPRMDGGAPQRVPVAYIRGVHVNDSLVPEHGIVGIRGRKDRLVVELGAIHYAEPERVTIQYRMDPKARWLSDFAGSIDLSAMEAGNHMLQVRASIDNVNWSEYAEMMVVVVPPLRDRWWARALFMVLGTLLVFAILRFLTYRRYQVRMAQFREREQLAAIRQRMAMDLHDDLGAELSSILLLTRMEREHPVPGSLERVEHLIGTLTEKVKEVIWSTDPGSDTLEATLAFIQRYTIKLCERHGLRVRTTIPTMLPRIELDAGKRRELYLIAKEAVNNTVKHAHATAFTLIVAVDDRYLTLDLADDGCGGTSRGKEDLGHGLRNMTTRAEVIGATIEILEVRPHGTRILLRMPIDLSNPNG
jgi:signal transduction histidine kinase/ligand-binding sensor domain-containing protein